MSDIFQNLDSEEKEILYQSTALIAIYAAYSDELIEKQEIETAKNIIHLRAAKSSDDIKSFYCKIEPLFDKYYDEIILKLPEDKQEKIKFLLNELHDLNHVISKLEQPFSHQLKNSLVSYAKSISNSKSNFLEAFLFPIDIEGINVSSIKNFNPQS
jgi:hypothetical protein